MGKRSTALGAHTKSTRSHKTAKRLAAKKVMLSKKSTGKKRAK